MPRLLLPPVAFAGFQLPGEVVVEVAGVVPVVAGLGKAVDGRWPRWGCSLQFWR